MELLETTAQSYEIEKIINESNDYLIIVSPYLQINNRLKPRLEVCFSKTAKTLILYRENKLTSYELEWFDQFKSVTLMPIKNLHAKCYLNEKTALISSMNLYDYSQIHNHEIGVKFTRENNASEIDKLLSFISNIIKTDYPQRDLSYYTNYHKEFTMGKLYAELAGSYQFPPMKDGLDGVYNFMCEIAKKFHSFEKDEYKQEGNALLRSARLNEDHYNKVKAEIIKHSIPAVEEKKEEYTHDDFKTEWLKHLSEKYKDHNFTIENEIIIAKDFPVENVHYSTRYGFASFEFNFDYDYMRKVKDKKDFELLTSLKDYRLYWSPANKINIYHAKNADFENVKKDVAYCAEGLNKILKEIKSFS